MSSTLGVLVAAMLVGSIGAVLITQYKTYNAQGEALEQPAPLESTSTRDACGSARGEEAREAQLPSAPSNHSAGNAHNAPPCRLR